MNMDAASSWRAQADTSPGSHKMRCGMKSRIMYIENNAGGLSGPARIGRVTIDDDVADEYWTEIRGRPSRKKQRNIKCVGKYR
jgi:hypothetical protein